MGHNGVDVLAILRCQVGGKEMATMGKLMGRFTFCMLLAGSLLLSGWDNALATNPIEGIAMCE